MISVENRERIRRAYFKDKKSLRQIAKELHIARKTVRKAIESAEAETYKLSAPRPAPILGPFKQRIDALLKENEHLPPKQRYIGHKIFKEIQKDGYQGSESTLRGYIGQRRQERRRPKVYLPLEFDPGTDAQVDWGEAVVEMAGSACHRADLLHAAVLLAQAVHDGLSGPETGSVFRRPRAGVPSLSRACRSGSPTTISRRPCRRYWKATPGRSSGRFIAFRSHYLFESYFCTPGAGPRERRRRARRRLCAAQFPGAHSRK